MLYKKLLFIFFYGNNIIFGMAQVAQLGVEVFAASMQKMAAVKMQTEGYKQELINTQKAITDIVEKEKAKTNNLILISSIKDYLIQQIELNKNENGLIVDSLIKIVYTSYKNFFGIIKQLKNKYNQLTIKDKNNSMLIKVAILIIYRTFNEYISLLKQYNYQLQNVSQKIQTNNQFNSVYVDVSENVQFVDPLVDVDNSIKNLDSFLFDIDNQSDVLIRSRDLLSNNNLVLFSDISSRILDTINRAENNESNKDVNDSSQVFYNLADQLGMFKEKLLEALSQFQNSQSEASSYLYKTIALLDINYNKIKKVILYLNNSIENTSYTVNDFIKDLYRDLLDFKQVVKKSKNKYLHTLEKNNIGFVDLVNKLKDFMSFLINNSQKLNYASLSQFLNSANSGIFTYHNEVRIKNKMINDQLIYFGYIDNYLVDLKEGIAAFQINIQNKSVNKDENIVEFNIQPNVTIFDKIYSHAKHDIKKNKNSHEIHLNHHDNEKDKKINYQDKKVDHHKVDHNIQKNHSISSSKHVSIKNNKKGNKRK